jgi:O-antigen biosynthesis protein
MISLSIIAKNEEKNIANCINSVKDIVSEIIVADTGSTDKTKEIASSLSAQVYDYKWEDDYSKARNFAKSKCTREWILVLDADEIISKKDLSKITDLIKNNEIAYRLIQRTYLNKKSEFKWNDNDNSYEEGKGFLGWQYRGIVRLFKNLKEIEFIYPIHETVKPSIIKIGKIVNSGIPIHHYPPKLTQEQKKIKEIYYLELLKKKAELFPIENSFTEIGVHLISMGLIDEGKKYLNEEMKRELILNN